MRMHAHCSRFLQRLRAELEGQGVVVEVVLGRELCNKLLEIFPELEQPLRVLTLQNDIGDVILFRSRTGHRYRDVGHDAQMP